MSMCIFDTHCFTPKNFSKKKINTAHSKDTKEIYRKILYRPGVLKCEPQLYFHSRNKFTQKKQIINLLLFVQIYLYFSLHIL